MVAVHVHAGGKVGFGYTYAAAAAGRLIQETLAPVVQGRDALAVPAAWAAMVHAVRNIGRPGIASMAIARRRYRPVGPEGSASRPATGHAARGGPRVRPRLRQRRLHFVHDRAAAGAASRLGGAGHPAREDEDRHASRRRLRPRSRRPQGDRRRSGAVRGRQRRLHPQAGAGLRRALCRARRELVRGAGVRRRSGGTASDPRPRPGRHGHRRRRVRL